jgi:diguanylate cyclase (GGDEF)-like protein/PAS domain S-box-containing protein
MAPLESIQEGESWYRTVVELSPTIILIHQPDKIVYANPAAVRFIKAKSSSDLINKSIFDFLDEASRKKLLMSLQELKEEKRGEQFEEYNVVRMDGETVVAEVLGTQITYEGKPAVLVVGKEVTERKRYEAEIKYLAYHDDLTGLPNRILFKNRIDQAITEAKLNQQQLAVVFIDLDGFKIINDKFGHEMGDLLLKQVANRLSSGVRKYDLVARFGGDEFILLLEDISIDETKHTVDRIIESITSPIFLSGYEFRITPSAGISFFPADGQDFATLIKHADLAMYKSKEKGKNQFQYFNMFE